MELEIAVFKRRFADNSTAIRYFANNFGDKDSKTKIDVGPETSLELIATSLKQILGTTEPKKYRDFKIIFPTEYIIQYPFTQKREECISLFEPLSPEEIKEFWKIIVRTF